MPFNIQALPDISTEATVVPQNPKDWEAVLERAASMEYEMYDMDMHVVTANAAYMSREPIAKHTSVHCELKLALQAMRGGNKMYSYIGVSKLPAGVAKSGCGLSTKSTTRDSALVDHTAKHTIPGRYLNISPAALRSRKKLTAHWLGHG